MKACIGRHRYPLGLHGRLECVVDGTTVCYRTMFGAIKDTDGQRLATCHGGFNKVVYKFRRGEADLILQYGWFGPKHFSSEKWVGALAYGEEESMKIFFAGGKRYAWDQPEGLVRYEVRDPAWKWRDTVIAFRAFDYFNPPSD